jgi:hypothetical protein
MKSVVYFIESQGRVKIGTTRKMALRLQALRCAAAHDLTVIATVPGGRELEQELHKILASSHVKLEWFKDTAHLRAVMGKVVADRGGSLDPDEWQERPHGSPLDRARDDNAKPWEKLDFAAYDALHQTILEVTHQFSKLLKSPALQDAAAAAALEREVGLEYGALIRRLYGCEDPVKTHSTAVKVVSRSFTKFQKISDRATLSLLNGNLTRSEPLRRAALMLIERAAAAVDFLQYIPGSLADAEGARR